MTIVWPCPLSVDAYSAAAGREIEVPSPLRRRVSSVRGPSYNQNLWMHHLTEGATYLPL